MAFINAPGQKKNSPSQVRKILKNPLSWLGIALILSLLLTGLVALLTAMTPSWYAPLQPGQRRVLNLADAAERVLLQLRNEIGNPARKTITWTITQSQINSLLAVRYSVPPSAGAKVAFAGPFVRLNHGRITLAIRDMHLPFHSVASVTIGLQSILTHTPGLAKAQVKLEAVHIGLVPVPRAKVLGVLHQRLKEIAPLVTQTLARYAGSQYAASETPQILQYIQHAMHGKPFPLTLRAAGRILQLVYISIRGRHTSASGKAVPARIVLVLKQISR